MAMVKEGLRDIKDGALVIKTVHLLTHITDNPHFSAGSSLLTQVKDTLSVFKQALTDAAHRVLALIAIKNSRKEDLLRLERRAWRDSIHR